MQGTISRLVADRGFGFISTPGEKKDVFFHVSGLAKELLEEELKMGDPVDFETESSEKGLRAIKVRRS